MDNLECQGHATVALFIISVMEGPVRLTVCKQLRSGMNKEHLRTRGNHNLEQGITV